MMIRKGFISNTNRLTRADGNGFKTDFTGMNAKKGAVRLSVLG